MSHAGTAFCLEQRFSLALFDLNPARGIVISDPETPYAVQCVDPSHLAVAVGGD